MNWTSDPVLVHNQHQMFMNMTPGKVGRCVIQQSPNSMFLSLAWFTLCAIPYILPSQTHTMTQMMCRSSDLTVGLEMQVSAFSLKLHSFSQHSSPRFYLVEPLLLFYFFLALSLFYICTLFFLLILFHFLTLQYCIGFAIYQNEYCLFLCLKSINFPLLFLSEGLHSSVEVLMYM